ncbi:hypothetical protein F2P56_007582 [Juglans regia]|uniref:Uncharacterized protein LOC108990897 n=2 Tax=Juglans regia TaxID=51240 RepID=A0A2I4EMD1_JUGRE|nr:uncharacterized protein LOC108990897 [Juglans regia]KAF5475816.1 hypothetical protein F2P56_007582 [Juglans regia]
MSWKHLCRLVRKFNVVIVAISESFSEVSKMDQLAYLLGLSNHCSNAEMGGKLWVFWSESYEFEVLCMSNQMITGWVRNGVENFLVTFVFAKCNPVERRGLWDSLKATCIEGPWLVVGDFNIIRDDQERVGGNPRPLNSMAEFNECLDSCGLLDLTVDGRRMSWCNGHNGCTHSWARLDLALINSSFGISYPSAFFEYLTRKHSDHSPMLLRFKRSEVIYGPHPFHFQNMWCNNASFKPFVEAIWRELL